VRRLHEHARIAGSDDPGAIGKFGRELAATPTGASQVQARSVVVWALRPAGADGVAVPARREPRAQTGAAGESGDAMEEQTVVGFHRPALGGDYGCRQSRRNLGPEAVEADIHGAIDDDAEAAALVVLDEIDHRLDEVRIGQAALRHQEASAGWCHGRIMTVLAPVGGGQSITCSMLALALLLVAAEPGAAFYAERIQPLLMEHCVDCHGPTRAKSGLRLDSRAAVLAGGDQGPATVPGDPEASLLLRLVDGRAEPRMPPDDHVPPLAVADLAAWIALGAPWSSASSTAPGAALVAPPAPAPGLTARLHPVAVHVPIGLALATLLAELLAAWRGGQWRRTVAFAAVTTAAGVVAAAVTGVALGAHRSHGALQDFHQMAGWMALAASVAAAGLAVAALRRPGCVRPCRVAVVLTVAAVAVTGHAGGAMTWGRGWLAW
jgi:uncharacterized membrane protein